MGKVLIDAATGVKPKRTPIWFLRQAGRYLPEYREIRKKLDFVALCQNPKLAAEVTLQPLRRFDLDAAIIFSDILIPCVAMGQELTFGTGHGPVLSEPVRDAASLQRLQVPDVEKDLGYVGDAIALVKNSLQPEQTMIGFAGAPFTVGCYMIEGKGAKNYTAVKKLMARDPEIFDDLLRKLGEVTYHYLLMQVAAGADCLMLFDNWASHLTPEDYRAYINFSMIPLVDRLKAAHPGVPVIYYPSQGYHLYEELDGLAVDVIAVDWRVRLTSAIEKLRNVGLDCAVQGNIDPQLFLASEKAIRNKVRATLSAGQSAKGHIFNVGHGLLPFIDPETVSWAVDEVRKLDGEA